MTKAIVTVNLSDETLPGNTPPVAIYRAVLSQGGAEMREQSLNAPQASPMTFDFGGADFPNGDYDATVGAYSVDNVLIGVGLHETITLSDPVVRAVPSSFA